MTAHVHAALMAEYAKDATETDKPWERWEGTSGEEFIPLNGNPGWTPDRQYRRKRIQLCQVEGRDVFPGDKLWHTYEKVWITARSSASNGSIVIADNDTRWSAAWLSWTEPPKTKTMYLWAILRHNRWFVPDCMYATEEDLRSFYLDIADCRRLDSTALEVPA